MSLRSELRKRCVHFAVGWLSTQDNYSTRHPFLVGTNWRIDMSDWSLLGPAELVETAFPEGTGYYLGIASCYKRGLNDELIRVEGVIRLTVHGPTERIIRADWHEHEPDIKPIPRPPEPEGYGDWS